MRYVFIAILMILLGGAVYLWMQSIDTSSDLVSQGRNLQFLDNPQQDVSRSEFSFPTDDSLDVNCISWGPFDKNSLMRLRGYLVRSGFIDNVYVIDRYLPDRWIVYQGPFDDEKKARDAVKTLWSNGFTSARLFVRAPVSFGVQLADFEKKSEADQFLLEHGTIVGLQVANRLGALSPLSDVQFRRLAADQIKQVHKWERYFSQASFGKCLKNSLVHQHPIADLR